MGQGRLWPIWVPKIVGETYTAKSEYADSTLEEEEEEEVMKKMKKNSNLISAM